MLFNSIEFLIFLPIVFFVYWFVLSKNRKWQNIFLLIASYVFYGWWDWRFLSLIFLSSLVDYTVGIQLQKKKSDASRRIFLLLSIVFNIGMLGFFKYFNFFVDNFNTAFSFFGNEINIRTLKLVLPVGISFYTFQTLSYTIDVYKRKLKPTEDIISFFAYVSFFPQLVAGPIERAKNLLPQFQTDRVFDIAKATDGLKQILWGLFKKIVIADNCAIVVNQVFSNYQDFAGSDLLLGAIFFAFQIYGDFSGYSDIAIGTARLFGFSIMQNFAYPYFSRDIAEFWRRWHISLSTWFRDYVYIPLGGSRGGNWMKIRNTFIIFLVSGFWHGANWTFITWGFINALYFLPLLLLKKNRQNLDIAAENRIFPTLKEFFQISFTFSITVFAWIFFRSDSIANAFGYISGIIDSSFFTMPSVDKRFAIYILLFTAFEWVQRRKKYALEINSNRPALNWILYLVIIIIIFAKSGAQQEFIYFQF